MTSVQDSYYTSQEPCTLDDVTQWFVNNNLPAPSQFNTIANVNMPKFETGIATSYIKVLQSLGINKAFDRDGYLHKIINVQHYISQIEQACFISVDESGAEAAATTMVEGDVYLSDKVPMTYTIDHPFIYMIRENSTGAILFMGKMVKM